MESECAALVKASVGAKLNSVRSGVSQGAVWNWETGRIIPDRERKVRIREVLGLGHPESEDGNDALDSEHRSTTDAPSAFGDWLNRTRIEKGLSVAALAEKAEVSIPAIYNIEAGRIENPRSETVRRLEKALGKDVPAETKKEIREDAKVHGVGEFFEFDPLDENDWPDVPGIYVLYDISERPIYVGQGSSIKTRIRKHEEKFWFKPPIVSTAAYIRIDNAALRKKIETILIRFLKRNAVINKQNVDRPE